MAFVITYFVSEFGTNAPGGPNGVDPAKFELEINLDATIVTPLDVGSVSSDGYQAFIEFVAEPAQLEKDQLDVLVADHDGEPFVGETFQKWESNSPQAVTANGWQTLMTRTSDTLEGGIYRMDFNVELLLDNGNDDSKMRARFRIDGSQRATMVSDYTNFNNVSGWDFQRFDPGEAPEFDCQVRIVDGVDSGVARRVKIGLQKVDD